MGKYDDVLAWYLLLLFKILSADKQPEDGGLSLRAVSLEGPLREAPPPADLHVLGNQLYQILNCTVQSADAFVKDDDFLH